MASETVELPIRISKLTDRYLLFDIDHVMYLRRHHNTCSPFVGTMPQAPSQNAFMGLPIELMAEEAKVLVAKNVAYIVDDSVFHPSRITSVDSASREVYLQTIKKDGTRAATSARDIAEYKKSQALSKINSKGKKGTKSNKDPAIEVSASEDLGLFGEPDARLSRSKPQTLAVEPFAITPVTSGALLTPPPEEDTSLLIDTPRGYPLYAHLHEKGYYMMPGLRFGCDYNVYPGDPLRYHSHFQATHYGWNEEIKLLDLVTGGRLGTNVKKAYLIGGEAPTGKTSGDDTVDEEPGLGGKSTILPTARTFSIEWAAM